MLAMDLRKQQRNSRRDKRKLAAVLPLILDEACLSAEFSSDLVPASVMAQYIEIIGIGQYAHRIQTPRVGSLISRIIASKRAVKLWSGGGLPVDSWNQCELAAQEVTRFFDVLAQGGGDSSDSDGDGDSHSERGVRRRRIRQQQHQQQQQQSPHGRIERSDHEQERAQMISGASVQSSVSSM
jgi:hypothetical protein